MNQTLPVGVRVRILDGVHAGWHGVVAGPEDTYEVYSGTELMTQTGYPVEVEREVGLLAWQRELGMHPRMICVDAKDLEEQP